MDPLAERLFVALTKCLAHSGTYIPYQLEKESRYLLALYASSRRQEEVRKALKGMAYQNDQTGAF